MDACSSSSGPYFYIEGTSDRLPPKHYGYWSMRWSVEGSEHFFDFIGRNQVSTLRENEISLFSLISEHKFISQLQFWAFTEGTYITYAFSVLRAPFELFEEVKMGIADGIKDIRDPNGKQLSETAADYVFRTIRNYARLTKEDFFEGKNPDVVDFHGSRAFQFMLKSFEDLFEKERNGKCFSVFETTLLQQLVRSSPIVKFDSLATKIGLKFSPAS